MLIFSCMPELHERLFLAADGALPCVALTGGSKKHHCISEQRTRNGSTLFNVFKGI